MSHDPVRIMDDDRLSSELRADLRVSAGPATDYDMDAGLKRLSASLAAGAVAGTIATHAGAATTVKATGVSILAKIVTGFALVGAVGGGVAYVASDRTAAVSSSDRDAPAPIENAPAASVAAAHAREVQSAPIAVVESERATSSASSEATGEIAREPSIEEARPRAKATVAAASSSASTARDEPSAVKEEIAFMAELRKKARTDPAAAAAMADEGQSRFPKGLFWQDREAIAIEALVQRGDQGEARRRASDFIARHPESPFAERIRKVTGMEAPPR